MSGIGLSAAQVKAVRHTWALIEKDLKKNGINLFVAIFKTHPSALQLFKRMKDIPLDELHKSPTLRAHAVGFMKELSGLIEILDNKEDLVAALEANAIRHHSRSVTVGHYEAVLAVYYDFLKQQLGAAFTKDASSGWQLVTKAIVATVAKEYSVIESE